MSLDGSHMAIVKRLAMADHSQLVASYVPFNVCGNPPSVMSQVMSQVVLGGGVCVRGCQATGRTVVHGDDVQAVQQLPLVLVDALHVHVEHGGGVDLHTVLPLQVQRELHLVVLSRGEGGGARGGEGPGGGVTTGGWWGW